MTTLFLFFFLFTDGYTGEVVKIDGFVTYEACESYRQKVVKREFSKIGECQNESKFLPIRRGSLFEKGRDKEKGEQNGSENK